jgi:hypothetical protein
MKKKDSNNSTGKTKKRSMHLYKKMVAGSQLPKAGFRVVKDSPVSTKIDKATINEAVEKALLVAARSL